MVKVVEVASDKVPAGSFVSYKDIAERWARIPMLAGEPIIDAKLAPKGAPTGLLARIPDGMRAFAIEVNEQSGISGFVLPENRVDVIVSTDSRNSSNALPMAETILQDVLVLAAGTAVTRPEDPTIVARTVTVALTPDQINTLAARRTKGTLTLSLRGHNDHSIVETPPPPVPEVPSAVAEVPEWKRMMAELTERLKESEAELERLRQAPAPAPLAETATPEPPSNFVVVRTLRGRAEGYVRIDYPRPSPARTFSKDVPPVEPPSPKDAPPAETPFREG